MKPVKDVLNEKGHDIWSITPDASVFEAIELMAQKEVGALLVLEAEKPIGIISERDYTRKVILKGKSSRKTMIKAIMTSPVIFTDAGQDVKGCMELMTSKNIRHLPVLENNRLVGIVSLGDLVKAIISEQESKIRGLESYFLYRSDLSR
ncbi:MAG: CBS domain-containing protein [Acidobacteria bacterium]|nr:CBS domain-containing protein [Acidobacteriota bacterium]